MRRLLAALPPLMLLLLPSTAAAAGESVTLTLDRTTVAWHGAVTAAGDVTPAAAGTAVTVAVAGTDVGTATTDAAGHFSVRFKAPGGGDVVARLASAAASPPAALAVTPVVTVKVLSAVSFRGATLRVRVQPPTWAGRITVRTRVGETAAGVRRVRIRKGSGRVTVPAPTVGRMRVELEVPAAGAFATTTAKRTFRATGRRLAAGSAGADVRVLLRGLERLGFHTPGISSHLSVQATDAIVAFQKAYRLPRTYVFGGDDWRKFAAAKRIRPRFKSRRLHIEIDKTRQILLVVRKGRVVHILPTSTGATGNTPEGKWKIRWKALSTTTWLGSAILFRTMTFKGNEFAIHGFSPVPAFAASHGCARIPLWAADWLYRQSPVGEPVDVYH
jgi:lipoprotein-anchoring transpeptidase ErfK/SrfK